jgi:hypothetical protein
MKQLQDIIWHEGDSVFGRKAQRWRSSLIYITAAKILFVKKK